MKTPTSHLLAALILPAAMLLCQCATTAGTPPRATTSVTAPSHHWVKVSSRPPTFYPCGVAADCPTDFHNGEWIHAGDAADTRYFIPLRGIASDRRKVLLDEALAARSQDKLRRIAAEDRANCAKDLWNATWYSAMTPFVLLGAAVAGNASEPVGKAALDTWFDGAPF